jgi:outer membrane protein assembly factor BamB
VQTKNAAQGLVAFKLKPEGVEELWKFPLDAVRTQSSPVIYDGNVYLMDDGYHYCLSLASGEVRWKQPVPSTISSPLVADGKIFVMMNSGNNLQMLKATADERVELGKANVRALWCPSPTISQGKLLVRTKDRVVCYDLREG